MTRASWELRLETKFPKQSKCCDAPTVGSTVLSMLVTGSGMIGNGSAANGVERNQLPGIGPLELGSPVSPPSHPCAVMEISPASLTTFVGVIGVVNCVRPGRPILFSMYHVGGPALSHGPFRQLSLKS